MSLEDLPEKHDEPKRPLSLVYTLEDLKDLALKIVTIPKNFHLNSKLKHIVKRPERKDCGRARSRLVNGRNFSFGQYSQSRTSRSVGGARYQKRGPFLNAMLNGLIQKLINGICHFIICVLFRGRFECINSLLSEAAALGFEYGYSLGIKG